MKSLKLSYILFLSFAASVLAFKSVSAFFGGVGLAFVLSLVLFSAALVVFFKNADVKKSALDQVIVSAVLLAMEFIVYFAGEIVLGGLSRGMSIYQSVISCLGVLFFAYVLVRAILQLNGKNFAFTSKKEKRVKAAKELTNGSLEDKPKKTTEKTLFERIQTEKPTETEKPKPTNLDENSEK